MKYLRTRNRMSQQVLSEALEIPRTTLGDYERGKTEPNISMLIKISRFFDVKVDELVNSNLSLGKYEILKNQMMKVLAITVDEDDTGNIELVDTKAEAGYLDSYQNPEYIKELPRIKIPSLRGGTYRAFEIQGDSMLPVESGSIIIASYVESLNEIKDDKSYVIISNREGLVYKRVRNDQENQCLMLISDNEVYLPYTLSYEDIDEIWQHHAHISFSDTKQSLNDKIESQIADIQRKVSRIHDKY
ncbi:MAG: helix-turn-helix domain-containing protein, partial [Bacteroidia bacterium]|nr:helix-turn-helix domain-containing protein [Bacteroidia bacterium]